MHDGKKAIRLETDSKAFVGTIIDVFALSHCVVYILPVNDCRTKRESENTMKLLPSKDDRKFKARNLNTERQGIPPQPPRFFYVPVVFLRYTGSSFYVPIRRTTCER